MQRRSNLLHLVTGSVILLASLVTDAAATVVYINFTDYQDPSANVFLQNTTGARIEYRMPINITGHFGDNGGGYADPRTGAMGGYAYAHIPNNPYGSDNAYSLETYYDYKVKVLSQTAPGNAPSLSLGDPVWLRFSTQIDGMFKPL
ncbi:MAG TPA: hypothetical protein ENK48_03795 [Gammaproteobacteria bacterium]|nr:hypothetical protein [Gammaproteobacteria bacterium]